MKDKKMMQKEQELNALYAAHRAASPEDQPAIAEQIRLRLGQTKPDEFAHAAGGTTINPVTMGVEKTPDVIYSKRTGQPIGAKVAAPTKVITKEMQAKLAPALAAQGLTLQQYASQHGLTVSK